jgi:hypothetical protein
VAGRLDPAHDDIGEKGVESDGDKALPAEVDEFEVEQVGPLGASWRLICDRFGSPQSSSPARVPHSQFPISSPRI